MFLINFRVDLRLYFRLYDVKDREPQSYISERPCPTWVSANYRLCVERSAIGIGSAYNYDQIVFTMLFDKILDTLLTLQVKRARSCSDKALGLRYYWFGTSALHTVFNGWTLHSIPFTNNDNLFPFQLHLYLLQ